MDVPAPEAGEIVELKIVVGDKVSAGDPLLLLRPKAASGSEPSRGEPAPPPQPARPAGSAPSPRTQRRCARKPTPAPRGAVPSAVATTVRASPRPMRAHRCAGSRASSASSSAACAGSGHKNRVTADDVKAFVKEIMQGRGGGGGALPAVPAVDFAATAPSRLSRSLASRRSRPAAARELAEHPARHPARRGGYHRARGEARRAQGAGEDAASSSHRSRSSSVRACSRSPRCRSSSRRSRPTARADRKALYAHRLRRRHAERLLPVIRDADKKDVYELRARRWPTLSEARASGGSGRRHSGRRVHGLEPWRHRRAVLLADHQRAGGRRSSACRAARAAGLSRSCSCRG